jgi:hypothetical protein
MDNTLCDFQAGILDHLEGVLQRQLDPLLQNRLLSIERMIGSPYPEFWQLKRRFEMEGGYADLPAFEDMVSFVRKKQAEGWGIVISTARPTDIKRVWHDSFRWLHRHGIMPNKLEMFGTDRVVLAQQLKDQGHEVLALDDDPAHIERLVESGTPVIVRPFEYNAGLSHPLITFWGSEE